MIAIPGLPPGVLCVRIGVAGPEEFEAVKQGDQIQIHKGPRDGSTSQIVVAPDKGYLFQWDIKAYHYIVVKKLDAEVTISKQVTFKVDTDRDLATVQAALDRLKEIPGYQEV